MSSFDVARTMRLLAAAMLTACCMASCERAIQKRTIFVQPFSGFSISDATKIQSRIHKIYPDVKVLAPIGFPQDSWNAAHTRRRADSIIHFLNRHTRENERTIGLTNNDISITKGKFKDWGVMGLGFCPGKSCVASTFRLDKRNRIDQLYKVAIHELGHTEGLEHCPQKTCFMRDAKGKNHKNEETGFCAHCKRRLVALGWNLK